MPFGLPAAVYLAPLGSYLPAGFWKEDGLAVSLCSAVHNQIHSGFHYWLAQHDLLVPLAGFALHLVQPISASLRFSRCQQDRRASFNLKRRTSASAKFRYASSPPTPCPSGCLAGRLSRAFQSPRLATNRCHNGAKRHRLCKAQPEGGRSPQRHQSRRWCLWESVS